MTEEQWREFERQGVFAGSPLDIEDGFIHFSSANQLEETLKKHFARQNGLVLLQVDAHQLDKRLKWEPSRNGEDFPHFYGELSTDWVNHVFPLPLLPNGDHDLPASIFNK